MLILHYITIAFRNLLKYKVQSAISIIGLSVGFACFAFCSYMFRVKLDFDKNFKDIDRICIPYVKTGDRVIDNLPTELTEQLQKEYPEIEASTAVINLRPYTDKLCEISGNKGDVNYFNESFLFADEYILDFLGLQLLSGDMKHLANTPDALVVTKTTALKLYGTTDVIGKTFTNIDDFDNTRETCTIRGVMQDFPPQTRYEDKSGIILNTTHPVLIREQQKITSLFLKVRESTDLTKLNQTLAKLPVTGIQSETDNTKLHVQLIPLRKFSSLFPQNKSMDIPILLFVIGLLVLLTALFNYVLFMFGQMLNRGKECGIRRVNGSGKRAFFALFFTESCITFMLVSLISLTLIELFTPFIESLSPDSGMDKGYLFHLMIQYLWIGLACIALLCWYVMYRLNRKSVMQHVHQTSTIRRKGILRESLICIQITISFLFLGGSWFIQQQSKLIESTLTAGLSETDKTSILNIHLTGDKLYPVRSEIIRKLKENPAVELISCNGMSLLGAWQLRKDYFTWDGITEEQKNMTLSHILADANYLEMLKQKPVQGRFFRTGEPDKAVVNESLARLMGNAPVGMRIGVKVWGEMKYYEITGIIPDIINNPNTISYPMGGLVLPCFYLPYPEDHTNMECVVRVRPGQAKQVKEEVTAELYKHLNKATPVYVNSLKENVGFHTYKEQTLFKMTSLFSVICILISLLGIHTAIRLSTEHRKKEVAIRKINGATLTTLLYLLGRKNLFQLIFSTAIAFPLLFVIVNNWIQSYPIRITIGVFPFILLFLLMGGIITFTVIWQIIKIVRTNPAETIKNE